MKKKSILITIVFITLISCSQKIEDGEITISSEDYSVSYNNKTFEKKITTSPYGQEYIEVKISYPELIEYNESIKVINSSILNQLLFDDEFSKDSCDSFDEIADSLFAEYSCIKSEFEGYSTAWFIHKNLSITGLQNNLLSLKNEVTMYTGGANAYYNVNLSVYDLNNANKVAFEEIIKISKLGEFLIFAERQFKEEKRILENQSVKDAGYWFENDKFFLPDNFNMTDSGLIFFYNLYEIAPRSEGPTELFIPTKGFSRE